MRYIKICPKCGHENPEEADLCEVDAEFLGAVPPTSAPDRPPPEPEAESAAAAPPSVAAEASPSAPVDAPPVVVAASDPAPQLSSASGVTTRFEPRPDLILELLESGERYTVRDGWIVGQEHDSRAAHIRLPLSLPGVKHVHRNHCRFVYEADQWRVTAIDQALFGGAFTNPTFVNNDKAAPGATLPLSNGDKLTLSGVTLHVRIL
ncbi:FHA domain-containing protein [Magnetofaba australis]|uniref:Putative Forkhead-associated protein n=1 Tax=Magnetofaba australis IT-1 TaxID=1434232 RepID=A0A1Y2JZK8_9PROT|nr:FHA domain-containing protein [Magnetofaba australis]OSM00338.1 putative Forkhead-associated protein [Magnetofaba australis IT-1]